MFTLGNRDGILSYLEAPLIIPPEAEKKGLTLTYEAIFRSLNHYLLETSSSEYTFSHQFFGPKTNIFHQIFDPIIAMFLEAYQEYTKDSYDAMGLLIMIRIARESMKLMQDRKIPILKVYFERLASMLWPRFEHVFKLHLDSVRSASPSDLGSIDHHPHYVIRRYSEFAAGIASLRVVYSDGRFIKLRAQMMKLIERLAVELSKSLSDARLQCVFLINNYDLILSVLEKWEARDSEELQFFSKLLVLERERFVKLELLTYIGPVIDLIRTPAPNAPPLTPKKAIDAAQNFAQNWEKSLQRMHQDIMSRFFPNFQNGAEIMKLLFAQLLSTYQRFQEVFKTILGERFPEAQKELLPLTTLSYGLKRFDSEF